MSDKKEIVKRERILNNCEIPNDLLPISILHIFKVLDDLFNSSSCAFLICDNSGKIIYASEYFTSTTHYELGALTDASIDQIITPRNRKQDLKSYIKKLNWQKPPCFDNECYIFNQDSGFLEARVIIIPFFSLSIGKQSLIFVNFNEKPAGNNFFSSFELLNNELEREKQFLREAEEEIDILKERLTLVEEVSEFGFWDINLDTGKVYFNDNFAAILGCQPNELTKFSLTDFDNYILMEDQPYFREALSSHFNNQSDWLDITVRLRCTINDSKWVLFKGKIILRDQNGEPLRFAGRVEDVTIKKTAEEKIKSNLQKEHELNELHTRFISMISHELRTPLATILSSAETIEMFDIKLNEKQKTTLFKKIKNSVEDLKEMLDDVTTLNRFDFKKIETNHKSVDIIKLSREIIEELKLNFVYHPQIHFESDCLEGIVYSNSNLLKHILTNLLTNAIKFTPSERNIYLRIKRLENQIKIIVEDEGKGIPDEEQKNIFEPFYRASNVSSISGTGLGLLIVKESLELLNGNISFVSKENIGTQFFITLPNNYNNSINQIHFQNENNTNN